MGLLENLPGNNNKRGWPWIEETDPSIYSGEFIWPRISIVTPSFNQAEFIEETIRSVLLQNYPNLEYIIIDGGSTDTTVEIIKKYEKWIAYWKSEPDKGQSHAINKGIEKCKGEIFNWLNSDDYYSQNALFTIANNFLQKEVNIVAGCNNRFIEKNGQYHSTGNVKLELGYETEQSLFFSGFRQSSTFFKLDHIKVLNGVRQDLNYVMDTEMFLRYILKFGQKNIKFLENIITNYRLQKDSKTVSAQEMFTKEIDIIYSDLAKMAFDRKYNTVPNIGIPKYDLSSINENKVISYYFALQALRTPRKNIFKYIYFIQKCIAFYPQMNTRFFQFLFQHILFYKKEVSDF